MEQILSTYRNVFDCPSRLLPILPLTSLALFLDEVANGFLVGFDQQAALCIIGRRLSAANSPCRCF
jgi:hypothetical protein